MRARVGVPGLTGASSAADRARFWQRAPREAVLLLGTPLVGRRGEPARATWSARDDVDWAAAWDGPNGSGWVVAVRPGVPLGPVRAATARGSGVLAGAEVDGRRRLVWVGAAGPGEESWADRPDAWRLTTSAPAESTYLQQGCVRRPHTEGDPDPLTAFSVSYADGLATARLGPGRGDLFERSALAAEAAARVTVVGELPWAACPLADGR